MKKDFPTGSSLTNKEKFKEEYVTSQQIKSLFSRWSQLKQKGKLIDAENSEEPEDIVTCLIKVKVFNL